MNKIIGQENVIAVINSFINNNEGDEATTDLLLAVGAQLLDVSADTMDDMIQSRQAVKASGIKILEATLLSKEEAKKLLTKEEKEYRKTWWLRSPGFYTDAACFVYRDGDINSVGTDVDFSNCAVRPVLKINIESSSLKIGDCFFFGGKEFKIISPKLAFIHNDDISSCQSFRENWKATNANVYEASDIKKFVDTWFERSINY